MSLMTDVEILKAIDGGTLVIEPWDVSCLHGASYDLRIGGEALVSNSAEKVILSPRQSLHLEAGDFALVLTKEMVQFPLDMAGNIGMRSSLARKGLILLAGMQIDPGFKGHLRFGLYNASPRRITIDDDDFLCMVEFHQLARPVERPQEPIPELVAGKIPQTDRDYLRTLETTSLSELGRNMKQLTENVNLLTRQMRVLGAGVLAILISVIAAVVVSLLK